MPRSTTLPQGLNSSRSKAPSSTATPIDPRMKLLVTDRCTLEPQVEERAARQPDADEIVMAKDIAPARAAA
jgi:hypothetical protein